jgi:hypothetical protein
MRLVEDYDGIDMTIRSFTSEMSLAFGRIVA